MSNLSSLRPPPVVGPVPTAPPPANHHGGHPSSPYTNGLPLSPRQLSGPAPPSRYAHPYQHHGRPVPPAHLPPPNMANGAPPPPPRHPGERDTLMRLIRKDHHTLLRRARLALETDTHLHKIVQQAEQAPALRYETSYRSLTNGATQYTYIHHSMRARLFLGAECDEID
ncbi:hypothetical protein FCULG_00008539 [Fusarium culmorum]|uniref:Uncharacterized protein n=1 Tax=Fusarium culmorum TaxID=5516 RepID=A0A2T4H039_FUSCU|nr:hypothetical protein FCULG_00008539 [Fusarium culmorum]